MSQLHIEMCMCKRKNVALGSQTRLVRLPKTKTFFGATLAKFIAYVCQLYHMGLQ